MKISYEKEELEDIVNSFIVTALEGGVGYWFMLDNAREGFNDGRKEGEFLSQFVARKLLEGQTIYGCDAEDESEEFSFNLKDIENGLNVYLYKKGKLYNIDTHDAEDADALLQFSIFGKWVYG